MSKTTKKKSVRKKADDAEAVQTPAEAPAVRKKTRVTKKTTGTRSKRAAKGASADAGTDSPAANKTAAGVASAPAAAAAAPARTSQPATPASRSTATTAVSTPSHGAFGAGLFDDDDSVVVENRRTAPVRSEKQDGPGGQTSAGRAHNEVSNKPVAASDSREAEVKAKDKDKDKEKEKETPRRKGWKSRKQRLAEEAEVIAKISQRGDIAKTPSLTATRGDADEFEETLSRGDGGSAVSPGSGGFAGELDDDMLDEAPPAEVMILPVDDSPLAPSEMSDAIIAEPEKTEEQDGRRRRRRRGRRGRGGRGNRDGRPGREGHGMESVGDTVVPFEIGQESEAEEDEEADEVVARRRVDDWDGESEADLDLEDDELDDEAVGAHAGPVEKREMLINVAEQEECRIAIIRDGRLDELFIERTATTSNVGNIYKGRVTNVEPSIQAAFVDFGLPAHGFLHISDLHPQYFPDGKAETTEQVGKKTPRRSRPPIQNCLKRGQEVIVQVIKEGIGTKGPTLTSYISLPGRFLVMMPGMDQLGVSRKIEDEEQRRRLRAMLEELTLPKSMGFIVRTAGIDHSRKDLQRDLNFLVRLWRQVERRIKSDPAPAELYKESDLVIRTIRDVYDSTLRRIVIDSGEVAHRVKDFLAIASPKSTDVVEVYEGDEPLFHRHGIESEIDRLHSKTVPLVSGGSLVIEQTEAMVAIDVNSGRYRVAENAEETAFRVNLEAVDEIARQLRLRDLGGLIVCDLIDMGLERHRRAVEKQLAEGLRKHKERAKILRISRFGLLEMTRQRQRPSLLKSVFRDCPRCNGSGRVKSPESVALDIMRQIRLASNRDGVARIDVRVSTMVANDLLNRKRHQLTDLERMKDQLIQIHGVESFGVDQVELTCSDRRGRDVQGGGGHSHAGGNGNSYQRQGQFQQQRGRRRGRGGRGRGGGHTPGGGGHPTGSGGRN